MTQRRRVMTEYGPGEIVASETVRGRTEYKVEGAGFSIWLTAQQVPEFGQLEWEVSEDHTWDNSTTLPYNPQPQFPTWGHGGESTIQPNQHVDSEERLSPADSVTFQDRPKSEAPGPNPKLFAESVRRTAAESMDELSPELQQTVNFAHQHAYDWALDQGYEFDDAEDYASWFARYVMSIEEMPEYGHDSLSRDWASERGAEPRLARTERASLREAGHDHADDEDCWFCDNVANKDDEKEASLADVQARLGDKYVDIPVDVDHSSLQARLDEDPARVVSDIRMSNFENRGELDPRIGQQIDLEYVDTELRTAAWSDVRKKAIRLRTSGAIQLEAANPTAIVARVTGDHGIYDVAVLRGNALTGSSSITEWTCSCPWGDWAFERERTFVGRLCSHAYAAYLELRSLASKRRKDKPYGWSSTAARQGAYVPNDGEEVDRWEEPDGLRASIYYLANYPGEEYSWEVTGPTGMAVASGAAGSQEEAKRQAEEAYDSALLTSARHPRTDGRLSTEPGTLTPDLNPIPRQRRRDRVDVQRDERRDITRTAEHEAAIESILPNSWPPEVRDLLAQLKSLWVEGGRPQQAAQWQEEVRDVVGKLRSLGFDSSGVATAMRYAEIYDWGIEGFLHQAFLSEPFEGSGPDPKESYSTSADQVALEDASGSHWHTDVDGPGDNPVQRNADDVVVGPRTGAAIPEDGYGSNTDYIAQYYGRDREAARRAVAVGDDVDVEPEAPRTAAVEDDRSWLLEGSAEPEGGQFDFAAAAQAHLKTAGRNFTFAEQQALMNEEPADGEPLSPDELDLNGTHYLS